MKRRTNFTTQSNFYCSECGNKGIPVQRYIGRKREKFHLKKLYCLYCNKETNHVECRTEQEEEEFLKAFTTKKRKAKKNESSGKKR